MNEKLKNNPPIQSVFSKTVTQILLFTLLFVKSIPCAKYLDFLVFI